MSGGFWLGVIAIAAAWLVVVLLMIRAIEKAQRRRSQQHAAAFKRWATWYEGKPNPANPKYNWHEGGGERYRRDLAAYPPEPRVKSLN